MSVGQLSQMSQLEAVPVVESTEETNNLITINRTPLVHGNLHCISSFSQSITVCLVCFLSLLYSSSSGGIPMVYWVGPIRDLSVGSVKLA